MIGRDFSQPAVIPAVLDNGKVGEHAAPGRFVKPEPRVRKLVDLVPASSDDETNLLGNRFLCRGAGALLNGTTGIGKSTLVIQMAICWAVGRTCFGIKPARSLKILYVQAENDEGDLCEMRDGVLEHLDLGEEEPKRLEKNFICVFENARVGEELASAIDVLLEQHRPDLLILDPALSYIGADAGQQEVVSRFLRGQLNPLLQKHNCAALVIHHTPKTSGERGNKKKLDSDFAYSGAGSAEWANWPRAILVLAAKDNSGLRELRIAKRFRLGWKDANGKSTARRLLRQNVEGSALFYSELTPEETMLSDSEAPLDIRVLHSGVLPEPGESVEKKALVARIAKKKICGRDRAREEIVPLLIDQGFLEEKEVPRTTGRPAIHVVRTQKMPNFVSFKSPPVDSTDGAGTNGEAA